jgi:hypothetical protein
MPEDPLNVTDGIGEKRQIVSNNAIKSEKKEDVAKVEIFVFWGGFLFVSRSNLSHSSEKGYRDCTLALNQDLNPGQSFMYKW